MFSPLVLNKILTVEYLSSEAKNQSLFDRIDNLVRYELAEQPWPQFETKCSASFSIAHTGSSILLKYFIKDDFFASSNRVINSEVNRDNCVEFFISFMNEAYYNIEFNCLGIGKIGYGNSRMDRVLLPVETVEKISVEKKLSHHGKYFDWEILLDIPLSTFSYQEIASLTGLSCSANFYKCGDDLPNKDFLAWNTIISDEPDFHKPEFFGKIVFESES
ncbi:carbohydrate-binding family 9-like protein [Pedobacter mucosus]|uniref:carbohydrate-binding family 9-like protein n=1 Tax=Pedobacter mucosus TaxID=2895286 RepID=UPI001EE4DA20|nr:carbohydrate-binding family 9-like protein [Pedobacter mucosus]UKT66119.1 hypothetical protein LOK61_10060 [Pedobacter mucosus]